MIGSLFTMATCNLFEDLRTVSFDQTLSHSESINISESDPLTINEEFTVSTFLNSLAFTHISVYGALQP